MKWINYKGMYFGSLGIIAGAIAIMYGSVPVEWVLAFGVVSGVIAIIKGAQKK